MKKLESSKNYLFYVGVIFIWVVTLFWYVYISNELSFSQEPSISLANLGTLGDSFNILTSLFAGLAFAAILITIRVQKKELEETREEFKKQREIMDLQQFDNKFFQMLGVFNDVIKNIKSFSDDYKDGGANTFQNLRSKALEYFNSEEEFSKSFEKFNSTYNLSIKYYFLNLYQVLNYIDIDYPKDVKEEKKKYTNIIRAQLSKDELVLLFYNCLGISKTSGKRYKELVEKYEFFEHLRKEDLTSDYHVGSIENQRVHVINNMLLKKYSISAFGENQSLIKYVELLKLNSAKDKKS